jgi:DNA-binding transcriptional regulator YhcF (GntR family)
VSYHQPSKSARSTRDGLPTKDGLHGRPTSARQLRELLVHRIASGRYPIGAQLPGTRELAVAVGANRNTVAKVYGELARDGLLQILVGRGAFVVGRVDPSNGREPFEQVTQLLDDALSRARLFGLACEDEQRLADERIAAIYDESAPRLVFLECDPYDAQLGASELTALLGTTADPVLVIDIPDSGAPVRRGHDELLPHRGGRPPTVAPRRPGGWRQHTAGPGRLLALARLPAGTRVGIVAANQAGVERFNMLVQTYCRAETRSLITPSNVALEELVRWADVLVSGLSSEPQTRAHAGGLPVIVLAFHVDPQSVQHIRSTILVAGRQRVPA